MDHGVVGGAFMARCRVGRRGLHARARTQFRRIISKLWWQAPSRAHALHSGDVSWQPGVQTPHVAGHDFIT
jgi:hypothetical protein